MEQSGVENGSSRVLGQSTGLSGELAGRIAAIMVHPHPVVRNLQITHMYHELTRAYLERLDPENVCWCAFATWASKQAGSFIRKEEAPGALLELLGMDAGGKPAPRPWYWFLIPRWLLRSRWFLNYTRCTLEEVTGKIAEGNLVVYSRLAPIFGGFLELIRDGKPDEAAFQEFIRKYASDSGTGDEIRRAFTCYYRALFESSPKGRAENIFLANVLIGLHEQMHLQEYIEGALKAPVRKALDDPNRRLVSMPAPMAVRVLIGTLFYWALGPVIRRFEERWLFVATQSMMTLAAPGGSLRLGEDLPPLADGQFYPELLRELTLGEVKEALQSLDLTPDTLVGSGARDWSRLADRMNYIADLFRSRQQELLLSDCPFSAEQVEGILKGEMPEGRL